MERLMASAGIFALLGQTQVNIFTVALLLKFVQQSFFISLLTVLDNAPLVIFSWRLILSYVALDA